MNKLLSIGQASKALGVTIQTLRNWDKKGLLKPDDMTKGGERRYKLETLKAINIFIAFFLLRHLICRILAHSDPMSGSSCCHPQFAVITLQGKTAGCQVIFISEFFPADGIISHTDL